MASGCQGKGDSVRAALATQEASWQRQLDTLNAQQAALRARWDGQAAAGSTDGAAARIRATLDGLGQSLIDVEIQMRQVGPRVEEAVGRGGDEADKALEEERARMNGYLEALEASLTSAGQQLDEFGRSERKTSAEGE